MKKIATLLIMSIFVLSVFAQKSEKNQSVRVGLLNGPSCIPVVFMMKDNGNSRVYRQFADPKALLPKIIKNEIDIGFMPVNVAVKVYNSSNKSIMCAAITGNGNISLITKDKELTRFFDLKGKKVYVAGQGATPEYMFRYLLSQNGVEDCELDFSIPTAQLAAHLISGKIEYAVVPEPFATIAELKSKDIKKALNFQSEYQAFSKDGRNYPLTVMVVRSEFAKENPDLLNSFLKDYQESLSKTLKNPKMAGELVEKYQLGLTAAFVAKSVSVSEYTYIPANNAKDKIEELLKIFAAFTPDSTGINLPEDDFYYEGKNN